MDDELDTLSEMSEGFLKSDTQSALGGYSRASLVDEALAEALASGAQIYDESEDEEREEALQLPKYACRYVFYLFSYLIRTLVAFRYCGIYDPASVALCTICDRWFCNGKGNTSSSHLVTHLVRSTHREVALHPEGLLGDTDLECYHCGSKFVY